ncbi:MAG TPA: hypothetical protein PLV52_05495, partial [Candidatus Omnitrophota bacterium]|nr:hypothetical protein [Candidatus Omnitrophota bacterium]
GNAVSNTTVYFYGTGLRASSVTPADARMIASYVFNGDYSSSALNYSDTPATDLRTRTHYFGYKGDELSDYAQNFMKDLSGVQVVKDTTIYTYGTAAGAASDVLNYTTSYKGGSASAPNNISGLAWKSMTDYEGTIRGAELTDYTWNYSGVRGSEYVSTTTVYFYGTENMRADSSGARRYTFLKATSLFNNDHNGANYSDAPSLDLRTRTHYFGYKGEELTDYAQNFAPRITGTNVDVKDTTIYSYRSDPVYADVLDYTTTYKGGTADSDDVSGRSKKSMAKFNGDIRGEEMARYMQTYNSFAQVSTTTNYYYGDGHYLATQTGITGSTPMTASNTYDGDKKDYAYTNKASLRSRTDYKGDKGEELVDTVQTFMSDQSVRDTTLYTYGSGALADVIDYTTTYKGGSTAPRDITGLKKKSMTEYVGDIKGEEVSQYTFGYGFSGGWEYVNTTTIYYYGTAKERAGSSYVKGNTAMTASATYYGDKNIYIFSASKTDLKNRTFYFGYKNEELIDYSQNYMPDQSGSSTIVKDTTIYTYTDDVIDLITTYKGGAENTRDSSGAKKTCTKYVGVVKGEEISDYTYNYGRNGTEVSDTTVYFYGATHRRASSSGILGYDAMTASSTYDGIHDSAGTQYVDNY